MSTKEIVCKCGCGRKKQVRVADIERGWGKYYSKSCKARHQESKTHQHRNYIRRKKVAHYSNEFGGIPQFNLKGEYIGFALGGGGFTDDNFNY